MWPFRKKRSQRFRPLNLVWIQKPGTLHGWQIMNDIISASKIDVSEINASEITDPIGKEHSLEDTEGLSTLTAHLRPLATAPARSAVT